jgi:hypothetical protein
MLEKCRKCQKNVQKCSIFSLKWAFLGQFLKDLQANEAISLEKALVIHWIHLEKGKH